MNKFKLFFTASKLLLIALILGGVVLSSGRNMLKLTQAVFTSSVGAVANKITTGYWTPATPVFEGFNLNTQSTLPNEQPLDLACGVLSNGGDPLHPRVALNWQAISGQNIIYQREVTYPSGLLKTSFYANTNYTDFVAFGSDAGINGLWQLRVRALVDVDQNGVYTPDLDLVSDWSNYCNITLDSLAPEIAFTNIPLSSPLVTSIKTFSLRGTITDPHLSTYQVKIYQSDAAGASGGALVADSGVIATTDSSYERDLYVWQIDQLNGFYLVELTATDSLDNSKSLYQLVEIVNPDPAGSTITVTNSPEKELINRVKNFNFQEGLAGWQAEGKVSAELGEQVGGAFSGDWVASLEGSDLLVEQPEGETSLSQIIDNQGKGLRSISFWYRLDQAELENQANPIFSVWVNDQLKFQTSTSITQQQNTWQMASIYVGDMDADQLKLSFKLNPNLTKTAVYLDKITTDMTVVNQDAVFTIYSQDPANTAKVFYQYAVAGQIIKGEGESGLTFSLANQPDQQAIYFWTLNKLGIESEKNKVEVIVDNSAPSKITDLQAYNEGEGEYSLEFSAPADNIFASVRKYEVRYSTQPITADTDWASLAQAEFLDLDNELLFSQAQAPLPAGLKEELVLKNLDINENYYFAIKSLDVAGNLSSISNIAVSQYLPPQTEISNLPILINEIAYNPEGNDSGDWQAGEWIELYNAGDKDLDLANWSIIDAAGKALVVTSANSDNNLNLADAGETIIPAKSWLVVYKNGARFLNNDGDSLALYNQNHYLVDAYFYQALADEGQTEARKVDGEEEWSFASLATPGRPNAETLAQLKPQVRLYQQAESQLSLKLFDANNYQTAQYSLTYQHLYDGQLVTDGLKGELKINNSQVEINDLYLGTCSAGGSCTPHLDLDPESLLLTVQLLKEDGSGETLTTNLTGEWQE